MSDEVRQPGDREEEADEAGSEGYHEGEGVGRARVPLVQLPDY